MNFNKMLEEYQVVSPLKLPQLSEQLLQQFPLVNSDKLSLRTEQLYVFCKYEDILCLEAEKRHTNVYFTDGTNCQIRYQGISELEQCLKQRPNFIRTHKSYIINIAYLKAYNKEREHVQMCLPVNRRKWLPVGPRFVDAFEQDFIKKLQLRKPSPAMEANNPLNLNQLLSLLAYLMMMIYTALTTSKSVEKAMVNKVENV